MNLGARASRLLNHRKEPRRIPGGPELKPGERDARAPRRSAISI